MALSQSDQQAVTMYGLGLAKGIEIGEQRAAARLVANEGSLVVNVPPGWADRLASLQAGPLVNVKDDSDNLLPDPDLTSHLDDQAAPALRGKRE